MILAFRIGPSASGHGLPDPYVMPKTCLTKTYRLLVLRLSASKLTTQKALACMIDFMFALSTLTNQAEVLKSTQKSALKGQLEDDVSFGSIAIG